MMGARLAWRGGSPVKSRPVAMKKKQVIVKPTPPTVEAAMKQTAVAPEIKTEPPPVTFVEPLKKEVVVKPTPPPVEAAPKKTAAAPEIKTGKPTVTVKQLLKMEEEKKTFVTAPQVHAVETPKVKTPTPVVDSTAFQRRKKKSRLDEKPAKTAIRAKRGRK
jgi:hypothetical protein